MESEVTLNLFWVSACGRLRSSGVLPRGYPHPASPVVLAKGGISIGRNVLKASLGLSLPPLPENTELRTRVLELGGGAAAKHERRTVFEAVTIAELPPPHNPYR